jgi:putative RecB family exonuclease
MSLELDVYPNEVAERLTGRDYLSYSQVSLYQRCPLQWHFKYALGLPEETVSSSLVFGGAIHRAAEFHFRELMAGNQAPDLDTLLYEYQAAWQERDLAAVQFNKDENVDVLGGLAERVLTTFRDSPLAAPKGRILGVEEELRGAIATDCPDLLARIDLLVDEGDSLVLTDLKTARSRWSALQVEDGGGQLLLYSKLVKEILPGKPLRLEFAVITKAKTPSIETHAVASDAGRIERTRLVIERTWRAMSAGHVYPSPTPMNCGGCPYRGPCREWMG